MSEFDNKFREHYTKYLIWANKNGHLKLQHNPSPHRPNCVRASSLYDCPLKAAKDKLNIPARIPSLSKNNNPTLLHRMEQGNRCAEPFQEMIYSTHEEYGFRGSYEVDLYYPEARLAGRCDALLRDEEILYLFEFKHRLSPPKAKFPSPRVGDLFQLLAYRYMVENLPEQEYKYEHLSAKLTIINTPNYSEFYDEKKGYEIWTLEPDGVGFILVNEEGYTWSNPVNNPESINYEELMKEVLRQRDYLDGETTPPIDLANSEEAWQCRKITSYANANYPGHMIPMCEHWCHTQNILESYEYSKTEEGKIILLDETF